MRDWDNHCLIFWISRGRHFLQAAIFWRAANSQYASFLTRVLLRLRLPALPFQFSSRLSLNLQRSAAVFRLPVLRISAPRHNAVKYPVSSISIGTETNLMLSTSSSTSDSGAPSSLSSSTRTILVFLSTPLPMIPIRSSSLSSTGSTSGVEELFSRPWRSSFRSLEDVKGRCYIRAMPRKIAQSCVIANDDYRSWLEYARLSFLVTIDS